MFNSPTTKTPKLVRQSPLAALSQPQLTYFGQSQAIFDSAPNTTELLASLNIRITPHSSGIENLYMVENHDSPIIIPPLLSHDTKMFGSSLSRTNYWLMYTKLLLGSVIDIGDVPQIGGDKENLSLVEDIAKAANKLLHPTSSIELFVNYIIAELSAYGYTEKLDIALIKQTASELKNTYTNNPITPNSAEPFMLNGRSLAQYFCLAGKIDCKENIKKSIDSIIELIERACEPAILTSAYLSLENSLTKETLKTALNGNSSLVKSDPLMPDDFSHLKETGYLIAAALTHESLSYILYFSFKDHLLKHKYTDPNHDTFTREHSDWKVLHDDKIWRFLGLPVDSYCVTTDQCKQMINTSITLPIDRYELPYIIEAHSVLQKLKDPKIPEHISSLLTDALIYISNDDSCDTLLEPSLVYELTSEILQIMSHPKWEKLYKECNQKELIALLDKAIVDHLLGISPIDEYQSPLQAALSFLEQTNNLPVAAEYIKYTQKDNPNLRTANEILFNVKGDKINFLRNIPDGESEDTPIWRAFMLLTRKNTAHENETKNWIQNIRSLPFNDSDLVDCDNIHPRDLYKKLQKIHNRSIKEQDNTAPKRQKEDRLPPQINRFLERINLTAPKIGIDTSKANEIANDFLKQEKFAPLHKSLFSRKDLVTGFATSLLKDKDLTYALLQEIQDAAKNTYAKLLSTFLEDKNLGNGDDSNDASAQQAKHPWQHHFTPEHIANTANIVIATNQDRIQRLSSKLGDSKKNINWIDFGDSSQTALPKSLFSKLIPQETIVIADISCMRHSQYYELREFCKTNNIHFYFSPRRGQEFLWICKIAAGIEPI